LGKAWALGQVNFEENFRHTILPFTSFGATVLKLRKSPRFSGEFAKLRHLIFEALNFELTSLNFAD
jgi:hypothetical protein